MTSKHHRDHDKAEKHDEPKADKPEPERPAPGPQSSTVAAEPDPILRQRAAPVPTPAQEVMPPNPGGYPQESRMDPQCAQLRRHTANCACIGAAREPFTTA